MFSKQSKFLVCIDEKDHSRIALRYACQRAKTIGCQVEMLYVIDTSDFNNLFSVGEVMLADRRNDAEKILRELAEESYQQTGKMPSLAIREGRISEEIMACAQEGHKINMLVLGAAPEGESRSGLLPLIAEEIGLKLHIPVLIVPGNITEQQLEGMG